MQLALLPASGSHLFSAALLDATTLQKGHSMSLNGYNLTKVVVFSATRPTIVGYFGHPLAIEDGGSAATGWVYVNRVWYGGNPGGMTHDEVHAVSSDFLEPRVHVIATTQSQVVFEYVLSTQRLQSPAPFNASAHADLFRYDASAFRTNAPHTGDTSLHLDEHAGFVDLPAAGVVDTLRWSDATKTAALTLNGMRHFTINTHTTRAVMAGHFGRISSDGVLEYSTGVIYLQRVEMVGLLTSRKWSGTRTCAFIAGCMHV